MKLFYCLLITINLQIDLGKCGSSTFQKLVAIENFGEANFNNCCKTHDLCYDTCFTDQKKCDEDFFINLKKECTKNQKRNFLVKYNCKFAASLYYKSTVNFGKNAFLKSKKKCFLKKQKIFSKHRKKCLSINFDSEKNAVNLLSDFCEENHIGLFFNLKKYNGFFCIKNIFENKCLKFFGGKFFFEDCNDELCYWNLEFIDGEFFKIKNSYLDYCLFFNEKENGNLFLDFRDCNIIGEDKGIWKFK